MQKTISFIIPSYNVEKYLEKCLSSFICPEIMDDMDVIIVNDGSTDSTHEIAQSYVDRYPKTFRLVDQENGGHGAALNTGTRLASGRYFKAVDSDDWVVTENLPAFISKLKACDADVVLTPYHQVESGTGTKSAWKMFIDEYERNYSFSEIMNTWKAFDRCFTFHGICYRTDFYQQYRYELPGKIFYEDHEYTTIPCSHAKSIYPIDIYIYQYLIGDPRQSVAADNRVKRMSHVEKVIGDLLKYYAEYSSELSEGSRKYFLKKTEGVILSYYMAGCILDPDKKRGRSRCESLNTTIRDKNMELYKRLLKKYKIFRCMSRIYVNEKMYCALLKSRMYKMIRN